jgi:hydroxypyruvate isomerase
MERLTGELANALRKHGKIFEKIQAGSDPSRRECG